MSITIRSEFPLHCNFSYVAVLLYQNCTTSECQNTGISITAQLCYITLLLCQYSITSELPLHLNLCCVTIPLCWNSTVLEFHYIGILLHWKSAMSKFHYIRITIMLEFLSGHNSFTNSNTLEYSIVLEFPYIRILLHWNSFVPEFLYYRLPYVGISLFLELHFVTRIQLPYHNFIMLELHYIACILLCYWM